MRGWREASGWKRSGLLEFSPKVGRSFTTSNTMVTCFKKLNGEVG